MNIISFIKELRGLELDYDTGSVIGLWQAIAYILPLVEGVSNIEPTETPLLNNQREEIGVNVSIVLEHSGKRIKIVAAYTYDKDGCKISYYMEDQNGEWQILQLPDEMEDPDYVD